MSESLSSKIVDPPSDSSKPWISTENLNPEVIRQKQKSMLVYRVFAVAALVSIPVVINAFSRNSYAAWSTSAAVLGLGIVSFFMYRTQSRLKFQIESACHQLGPGVRLRRKYLKDSTDLYQIFQEGHRYYYIQSLQTGEKRLVPKDKILQDYDLAI